MGIYRVTTPTIVIEIENEDFDMSLIDICHVTIQNHSGRNKKIFNATNFDVENRIIYLELTQEETKEYETGNIEIQLKIKLQNGKVIPSEIITTTMNKILEEDIL